MHSQRFHSNAQALAVGGRECESMCRLVGGDGTHRIDLNQFRRLSTAPNVGIECRGERPSRVDINNARGPKSRS
jgi:hypothetical protein